MKKIIKTFKQKKNRAQQANKNKKTIMKVRDLDSRNVQIQMNSPEVDKKLLIAIDDMYSIEGIEYQKKLLLRSIDF